MFLSKFYELWLKYPRILIIFPRDEGWEGGRRCSAELVPLCKRSVVDCIWNVMAHAQKPEFVFRRNGRVHLNRRGRQFSRLLAAELCASAVVMLDTPCSEVVWRVLAAHSIHQFPLHFLSRASPCAITFQLDSTTSFDEHCFVLHIWRQYFKMFNYLLRVVSNFHFNALPLVAIRITVVLFPLTHPSQKRT